jgi:hypothetical protein
MFVISLAVVGSLTWACVALHRHTRVVYYGWEDATVPGEVYGLCGDESVECRKAGSYTDCSCGCLAFGWFSDEVDYTPENVCSEESDGDDRL